MDHGGTHEKFATGVKGICTKDTISNNVLDDVSSLPGFGGHSGITAFFVDTLTITYNHIQKTAYNDINLGWGWQNFKDSTTCKNNAVNNNRFINTLSSGDASNAVGLAPTGTTNFVAGGTMTKAAGDATSIAVPASAGTYKLSIVDSQGKKLGESAALLRVK